MARVTLLLAATAIAVSGCGNISHGVSSDGTRADALVWPALTDTTPMHQGGTFPNIDDVRKVRPGLNKHQVADLIGFPHFSEGVWGVREWNYVFNFREANGDAVVTCQFKILFDTNKLVRSVYWSPESCGPGARANSPVVKDNGESESEEHFVLSSDALFPFDQSSVDSILGEGKVALDDLARSLEASASRVSDINIAGYTDRLGSYGYNEELSRKRAYAVKDYLVAKGISAERIQAEGRGKSDPVKECRGVNRSDLISCLAPNRRVEVRVGLRNPHSSEHGAD